MMSVDEQRAAVVAEARTWLGTKYHHQACMKGKAVDCMMFIKEVYRLCEIVNVVDLPRYNKDWNLHRGDELYQNGVENYCHKVDAPGPGDIALFRWGRTVSHGGIILDYPLMIHSFSDEHAVVISDISTDVRLKSRLVGFWSPWGE